MTAEDKTGITARDAGQTGTSTDDEEASTMETGNGTVTVGHGLNRAGRTMQDSKYGRKPRLGTMGRQKRLSTEWENGLTTSATRTAVSKRVGK